MKYIEISAEGEDNKLIIFSEDIHHDSMFECVRRLRKHKNTGWRRKTYNVVSAGFINPEGSVYGRSETLGIDSRKEAEELL